MDKEIFQDVPLAERPRYLRDNAHKVDPKYTYHRELEEAELQERKNSLSQNMIKMDVADQSLKEAKEAHSAVVKPLKQANAGALQEIRSRAEEITGEVYLIKDSHSERMGIYSPEGKLLFERGLLPEERQFSIVDNFKQAL